jgi:hypothetical protein
MTAAPQIELRSFISLLTRLSESVAQDDGLVGVLKNLLVGCVRTTKIKKSQPLGEAGGTH